MNFKDLLKGKLDISDALKTFVEQGAAQVVTNTQQAAVAAQQSVQPAAAPQGGVPPTGGQPATVQMSGPGFEPINGVSLEKYVDLLVNMVDCGEDEARCIAVALEKGVARDDWFAAKDGWTARMSDPSLEAVRTAFVSVYGAALDKKRGGAEPMPLETFVVLFAETSFRKDPNDPSRQIDRDVVLKEHNVSVNEWNEALYYWSPKVSDQHNPIYKKYGALLKQESERIFASSNR